MKPVTPLLTVDGVIVDDDHVVLIQRKNPPFEGSWALPGGFVDVGETVETACVREMEEETSLKVEPIRLLGVYSDPERDPRGHTVSVVYICRPLSGSLEGCDDALEAKWFPIPPDVPLAFDHAQILRDMEKILEIKRRKKPD